MPFQRKPAKQGNTTPQPNQDAMPQPPRAQAPSRFPDPQKTVKLPRKPFLAIVRDGCLRTFRAIFSPEAGMFVGYSIAIGSVLSSVVGYYAIVNAIAIPLGFAGLTMLGLNVVPLLLGTAVALTIQYKEIAPQKFVIFPHLADRAAFKAGKDRMVDPSETPDTPSMLGTFKYMARNGDSIRDRSAKSESTICYVIEGIGAFTAIGFLLGSTSPLVQIGAVVWAIFSVWGCEGGLKNAEKSAAECLNATQVRDYLVEKARISP
jgi:hypothetical protein